MNKKQIIIFSILAGLTIALVILGVILVLMTPNRKDSSEDKKTQERGKIISFSDDFIKDFSTFSYKDSKEYNERMRKYIAPSYYPDFKSRLLLRDDMSAVPASKKEKYSQYKSSKVSIISENSYQATVSIKYTSVGTDPPVKPNDFEVERAATIVVDKTNLDDLKITSFQFSNI